MCMGNRVVAGWGLVCLVLVAAVSCGRLAPEQKATNQGILLMNERNFSQAEETFRRAINLNPDYIEAYIQLATCYRSQLKHASATEVLEAALAKDPKNRLLYSRKANIQGEMGDANGMLTTVDRLEQQFGADARSKTLRGRGLELSAQWDEALAVYDEAIALDKTYGDAYRGKARIYLVQNELEQAEAALRALIAVHPDDLDAQVELAVIKSQQGKNDEAKQILAGLSKEQSTNHAVLAASALIHLKEGDTNTALQESRAALQAYGRNGMANYVYAAALHKQGRPTEALPYARMAVQLMPGQRDAAELFAEIQRSTAPLQEVKKLAEQMEQHPDDAELKRKVASAYLRMGWSGEAIAPASAALTLEPTNRDSVLLSALAYATSNQPEQARVILQAHPPAEGDYLLQGLWANLIGDVTRAQRMADQAISSQKDVPWAHYLLASCRIAGRDLRGAVKAYEDCYDADTGMTIALIQQAQLYQALGLINPAINAYGRVLATNPDDWRVHLAVANLLNLRGNRTDAEKFLKQAQDRDPKNAVILFALGSHYEQSREYDKAILLYQDVLKLYPESVLAKLRLANLQCTTKSFTLGVKTLEEILAQHPQFLAANALIALARWAQDRFDDAAQMYEQVLSATPDAIQVLINYSAVQQMRGRHDEALAVLERLRTLGLSPAELAPQMMTLRLARKEYDLASTAIEDSTAPEDYKALARLVIGACRQDNYDPSRLLLARALASAGWVPVAVDHYARIVSEQPRNALAHTALGELYVKAGSEQEALLSFQRALSQYDNSSYLHRRMGEIYLGLKQTADAFKHLKRSVDIDPQNAAAWLRLAQIHEMESRPIDAQAAYRKVIELAPSDPIAYNNLAYNMARDRTTREQALGYAEQALRLRPTDGDIQDTVGYVRMLLGDDATDSQKKEEHYRFALRHVENALTLVPDQPTVTYHYGMILERVGRFQDAVAMYRRSLRIDPKHTDRLAAMDALDRLKQKGYQ